MDIALIGGLGVVLGSIIGVGGALIAEWIRSRHERAHFLLQLRIDAHAHYIVALTQAVRAAEAAAWDRGTPEWAKVNPDINGRPENPPRRQDALDAIHGEALERVGLLAELPVARAAIRAANAASVFLRSAGGVTILDSTDVARLSPAQQQLGASAQARLLAVLAIADYRTAAREDAGFNMTQQRGLWRRAKTSRPGGG